MTTPWILVRKNLFNNWFRSGLTIAATTLAMLLFCIVTSIVTTLDKAIGSAAANRLVVQSEVSLFVDLPLDYQAKIAAVPGVEDVSKMQWFGGYYQDENNFFAQFAVDQDRFFDMYAKDIEITEGLASVGGGGLNGAGLTDGADIVTGPEARAAALAALYAERRGTIVGQGLMDSLGWKVGQTVPITGRLFPRADGSAWDFVIVGVYRPSRTNVDDRTMWFRWDYFEETVLADIPGLDLGTGVFMVNRAPGADAAGVIADIDALFAAGPQKTATTTEAAFQATFVAMLGSLPEYMQAIGGAIVFAVLFSVVNTMLLAARQRTRSVGILKALGFSDAALGLVLLAESSLLALLGGGAGVALAKLSEESMRVALGPNMPGYAVEPGTLALGLAISGAVGLIAGLGPSLIARGLTPVDALRSEG
ncbi:MAG: putative ABC transport system permease protein [Pseudohongiellaceae bacterium]|jgi:putative ABC transport system permease protein